MRLIHLSDLHLGKRVNEFSMIDDQRYILKQVIGIIDDELADGVIIAGDVYDKTAPNEEAVRLLDEFLNMLAMRHIQVFIISGNHDSAVKLSFASGLIGMSGIHIAPVYDGIVCPFRLSADGQSVNIYMLPFLRPASVRAVFEDSADSVKDYTDACRVAIEHMQVNTDECNILVAHQFVTGAERSESEEISVGGLDCVDASVFDCFDYVALGHIHGPQHIGRDTVRYCGTLLKYSFSEIHHRKSVTVLDIDGKNISVRTREVTPLHDMREIKGTYDEVIGRRNYEGTDTEDYVHIILTDEEEIINAMGKLRTVYPNIMKLSYDNTRTGTNRDITGSADIERKSPLELFCEFYEIQNNQPMTPIQRDYVTELIESIWEEK